jgi:hypothetical protein
MSEVEASGFVRRSDRHQRYMHEILTILFQLIVEVAQVEGLIGRETHAARV